MDRENPLILVVDDETHILHVVSLKLTRAGYDVITAEDGEEALEMAGDAAERFEISNDADVPPPEMTADDQTMADECQNCFPN